MTKERIEVDSLHDFDSIRGTGPNTIFAKFNLLVKGVRQLQELAIADGKLKDNT